MPRRSAISAPTPLARRIAASSFSAILSLRRCRPTCCRQLCFTAFGCIVLALLLLLGARAVAAETALASALNAVAIGDPFAPFIADASQRFRIPASWIRAIIRVESGGDVQAVSPKGAMGLMQLMPETWASLRLRYSLGTDPLDPHDNILAGAAYLRELFDRYGAPGFLAAYNAGPARYDSYLATSRPLPDETRAYLAALTPLTADRPPKVRAVLAAAALASTTAPLFVAPSERSPTPIRPSSVLQPERSSAAVRVTDVTGFVPGSSGLFVAVSARSVAP